MNGINKTSVSILYRAPAQQERLAGRKTSRKTASQQKAWELLDGPIGDELAKKLEPKNLILLSWMDNGIRQITNSNT